MKKRILLVEDNELTSAREQLLLEEAGFNVTACQNGSRAWEELQRDPDYDLIISDWQMPVMDGRELLKKIRADEHLKLIPFWLVSGMMWEQDYGKIMRDGATKAFQKGKLGDEIKKFGQ